MIIRTNLPIISASAFGAVVTGRLFKGLTVPEQQACIAHEFGHIRNNHGLLRLWWAIIGVWLWDSAWLVKQIREQEFEADRHAVKLGYAQGAIAVLIRFMAPETPLHPSSKERIDRIKELQRGK